MFANSRYSINILLFSALLLVFSNLKAQSPDRLYLSGQDDETAIDWDFFCTDGRNSGQWTKIPVPSCWELKGFGTYNYGRDKKKSDEKGLYKTTFKLPANFKNKNVKIWFEGVMTDAQVKLNGKFVGIHQGAFYRFGFDVNPYLTDGENTLEVEVAKKSADTSVNRAERDADYWVFGGIFRPVYLEAKPVNQISHFNVDARHSGLTYYQFFIEGKADKINIALYDLENRKIGQTFTHEIDKESPQKVKVNYEKILPWTPETPNLYLARFELVDNGAVIYRDSVRVGFRTIEFKPRDGFYLNGIKIKLKGANRHCFWPSTGRTISADMSFTDISLMKEMNMNAVRMSHYPPDQHFLDICDSLGLLVINELAGWQKKYDTPIGMKLVKELVERDVNHPSVIIWANGNEGGFNNELNNEYHKYDPQKRLVIHPWESFNQISCHHYLDYDCCPNLFFNGTEVYMPTEFLHGLHDGGHGAGLDDYWKRMYADPLNAGGFLWCLVDEGIERSDRGDSIDIAGHQAPDGILGPYREKEASFYTIKEIWSPVVFATDWLPTMFNGNLPIDNRFYFTNLKDVKFTYKLSKLPSVSSDRVIDPENGAIDCPSPNIPPQTNGMLKLPLPAIWGEYDLLSVNAYHPNGDLIISRSWFIKDPQAHVNQLTTGGASNKLSAKKSGDVFELTVGKSKLLINSKTGLIDQTIKEGEDIKLNNGPRLAQSGIQNVTEATLTSTKTEAKVTVSFDNNSDYKTLIYTLKSNGWLKIEADFYADKKNRNTIGLTFDYNEEGVKSARLAASGPYRVWQNRTKGPQPGVYEKTYNNTITGEDFEYPEFKGYYSDFNWVKIRKPESDLVIATGSPNVNLHLFTPSAPRYKYNNFTTPIFPEGNLSFLYAISPIGNKFAEPEKTGPSGYPVIGTGRERRYTVPYKMELYFYLGNKLPE